MKKKITSSKIILPSQSEDIVSTKLDNIENLLKVIDEKNEANERSLRWEIKTEVFGAQQSLEKNIAGSSQSID